MTERLAVICDLYHFEHLLCGGGLARDLLLLPAGGLGFLHAVKLLGGVFQPQMGVGIEGNADVGMPHEVLERLRVHARLGLIAAVGMAADVRRDVGHPHPVNVVVAVHHVVEAVLPVHGHQRQAILVQKQETAVPVDHALITRRRPVLDDGAEALLHILRHGQLPGAGMGLGLLDHKAHVRIALKLMIDVDQVVLKVDVLDCQPAKLRDAHPGMEQDVYDLFNWASPILEI